MQHCGNTHEVKKQKKILTGFKVCLLNGGVAFQFLGVCARACEYRCICVSNQCAHEREEEEEKP